MSLTDRGSHRVTQITLKCDEPYSAHPDEQGRNRLSYGKGLSYRSELPGLGN